MIGVVGETSAAADEFVRKLGFDLRFSHAGFDELADAQEARFGDRASLADQVESRVRI